MEKRSFDRGTNILRRRIELYIVKILLVYKEILRNGEKKREGRDGPSLLFWGGLLEEG